MPLTLAIVGRPNVGKSTLYNRLTGRKSALVDNQPGVTRDRRAGKGSLAGLAFTIVDTAGMEDADPGTMQSRMTEQSIEAVRQADATLLMVDGRAGITPVDQDFARRLRKLGKKVIVVINKVEDGKGADSTIPDALRLGFGEPVAISAEHGQGMSELYDAIAPFISDTPEVDPFEEAAAPVAESKDTVMRIAIVGRPNAGKSTLMNTILGQERVLTGPEAGMTRDAITIAHTYKGTPFELVDTAGIRRKANVTGKIEKLAVADALRTIEYAHVVVLVLDAQQPLEKQDNNIAALTEQEGRALVIAINKWDTVTNKAEYEKQIQQRLKAVLAQAKGVPLIPISAKEGTGIGALLKACFDVYDLWNTEIGTGELNRWLEVMLEQHNLPMVEGRRVKIRYITQRSNRPPTFWLFSNLKDVPESYLRYLSNGMRERFKLPGIPIRIRVRKNKNPYDPQKDAQK